MTQSDLAGAEFSVGFISRIESGARQPSRHTLTTLATRLNVAVGYLESGVEHSEQLTLRYDVDRAELALAGGDVDDAMSSTAALLAEGTLREWPELERRARLVHALAQESAGDMHSAIIELEDLLVSVGDGELASAVGIALSRCYREADDHTQAIEIGERVLRSLDEAGLAGTTEHIRLSMTVAAAYYESGQAGVATRMARRAVKVAEANSSPEAQAAAYWNASIIERNAGHLDRAVAMGAQALAILESGTSTRNLARLRNQLAMFQLSQAEADLAEVRSLLELSRRELQWSSASPTNLARNTLAFVRLELREGAPDAALATLAQVAPEVCHQDPLISAELNVLTVLALAADDRSTDAAYAEAASLLDLLGSDRGIAQLWFELGEAMAAVGDEPRSRLAYRQAAVCYGAATVLLPIDDRPAFVLPPAF